MTHKVWDSWIDECKPSNSIVCPICWRANCRLFRKMMEFKYTAKERCDFLKKFHHNTCTRCKRRSCDGTKLVISGTRAGERFGLPCNDAPPRKLSKKKKFPDWWTK